MALAVCIPAIVMLHCLALPAQAVGPDVGMTGMREQEEEYVPGEVLVLLSADVDKNGLVDTAEDFAGVEAAVDGTIVKRIGLSRDKQVLCVKLPAGKTVGAAIAEDWGARDRRILTVEPNYRVRIARTPNDPLFPQLWGLNNTGQTAGLVDADIDAPEAWDVACGVPEGSDVIVAVIDTGIDYLHPDLADNMWVNTDEIPGNGLDDDLNGYIDDIYGYDFVQDDSDPSDAAGHGTHCAGTIAGVGDNGLGIAGVNWRCKVMAVRFLDAMGFGDTDDAIEAINYAVANGAKILSNSWGGGGSSSSLKAAIINARDQGVLFVAAAGNWGMNNDLERFYPASFKVSNVISVAATDDRDSRAFFSNYGAGSVHLGAPGVNIVSSVPKYRTLFFEDFEEANMPGFEGTQMTPEGPTNRWGTVLLQPPPPPDPPPSPNSPPPGTPTEPNIMEFNSADDLNNITAHGDWANAWPYLGDSNGSIVTPWIDTRGLRAVTLEFIYRYEIGWNDEFSVDVWDGAAWQKVFSGKYGSYQEDLFWWTRVDIPESYRNEQMEVRFRWVTDDEDNNHYGVEIDNIRIQCIDDHTENYASYQGTSMATPHVSGVAALLMGNPPGSAASGISPEELKSRLIWTGDAVPSLDGRTISGRRLNAYKALTSPPEVCVVTPNGGQGWVLMTTHAIEWYSFGCGPVVDIYLLKGEEVYAQLAEGVPNNGRFSWEISGDLPAGSDYRIMITDGEHVDVSDEDFELLCPPIPEPDYPYPFESEANVPVNTNLTWLPPVTVAFGNIAEGTIVDGMVIGYVTFNFTSYDATVTNEGPVYTRYVHRPNIEGDAAGTLTLNFAMPVYGLSYGFALSSDTSKADATTMSFYDRYMNPLGSFSVDAIVRGYYFVEGLNRGTSTTPIKHVDITFSHPDAVRFTLDNLTYSVIPGGVGLPEASEPSAGGVADETKSEIHQDTNSTEVSLSYWSKSEVSELSEPEEMEPEIAVAECCVKESEAAEAIAADIGVTSVGGPDAGDYIFIDSDEPNGPSFDWIEIAGTGTNLGLDDDDSYFGIELPFDFYFYGGFYSLLGVSSNGTIQFIDSDMTVNNCCIPCNSTTAVQRFIAVYWDDLNPTPGGSDNVYYAIVGEEPNRILVVQWENVAHYNYYGSVDWVTCQAQLFEGSSDILLLYADPSSEGGSGGTVGIQSNRSVGLNYLCNQRRLYPGLSILFKHKPPCPTTWDVYFGTEPNTLELIESDLILPMYDLTPEPNEALKRGMRYYWQVVVKNCCSRIDGNSWTFTTENTPPAADAGDNRIVECACNSGQGTQVTLDGTRSSDADGNPLTYTWTGPFLASPVQEAAPTVTLDSGCTGEYVITLVVNDVIEDSEPNEVLITVVDTTPPEFEFSVSPTMLWPPNHKMVEITPIWTVSDECDAAPDVSLVGIEVNEDGDTIGDGHTSDDIEIGEDGSIYLRAERSGPGSGRIYTITYQAVDDSGNTTVRSAAVRIPHKFKLLARMGKRWLWRNHSGNFPEDLNDDGIVNLKDFAIFANNWILE